MTTIRVRRAVGIIIAVATGVTATFVAQSLSAEPLRVGVASVDITPPLGAPMAGYYHERGADGVLDPLYSKAMVIQRDDVRMAFVALDIISVTREITDQAREKIEEQTGIPGDHVMISATHAHTGPELARRSQRVADMGGQNKIAVEYTEALPDRIAETVRLANEQLQPAQLKTASGRCEDLAYNRRYFMRDGTVGWNPGKLNPEDRHAGRPDRSRGRHPVRRTARGQEAPRSRSPRSSTSPCTPTRPAAASSAPIGPARWRGCWPAITASTT